MNIARNCELVKSRITKACNKVGRNPEDVTIVAITKTISPEVIKDAFRAGLRHFGENRVQEAHDKTPALLDIRPAMTFHMVGHLQSNKAPMAIKLFDYIQSVDSVKLAEILNQKTQKELPVLIQVDVTGEVSKNGIAIDEISTVLPKIASLPQLRVEGLMTIAPLVDNPELARPVFKKLRQLRNDLGLKHLSMGMTNDFEVAIEEGATMVRIGRAIFGERTSK